MPAVTPAHARDLGDYAALVRRRKAWILVAVVIGVLLAFGYLSVAARTYASTAKVLVKATGDTVTAEGARTNDGINLDTEAQLVMSEPVAERAGEILGSDLTPVALADRVAVTVPPNTTVMVVTFQAASPEDARDGAAAFAEAYLESRQDAAQGEVDDDIARLRERIEQVTKDIESISVALSRLDGPRELSDRAFLLARRATLNNQLTSYNTELAPLVGEQPDTGQLIMEARLPREAVDPDPLLVVPAGLVLGLVAGLALAVWRERRDRRLHSAAEVERLFGVAPMPLGAGRGGARLDVRALYHVLGAHSGDGVVLMVGPDLGPEVEELSCSLAITAARSGATAAYVGRPGSSVIERVKRSLTGDVGSLLLLDYAKVGVIVDGQVRSARLPAALRTLTTGTDLVALALPEDDPTVDVPLLARHVDSAVVVVGLGVTRRESLAAVLADLSRSGVEQVVLGALDLRRFASRPGIERRTSRWRRRSRAATPATAVVRTDEPVDQPRATMLRVNGVHHDAAAHGAGNGAGNGAVNGASNGAMNGSANGAGKGASNGHLVAALPATRAGAERGAGDEPSDAAEPGSAGTREEHEAAEEHAPVEEHGAVQAADEVAATEESSASDEADGAADDREEVEVAAAPRSR